MNPYTQFDLPYLYEKAKKTGSREDVLAALHAARTHSAYSNSVFHYLIDEHQQIAADYCGDINEIPTMFSSDESTYRATKKKAEALGLGKDSKFKFTGCRETGLSVRRNVVTLVNILDKTRTESRFVVPIDIPEPEEYLELIKQLPDLSKATTSEWVPVLCEFAFLLSKALEDLDNKKFPITYDAYDLYAASRKYMESRLESKKKQRRRAAEKRYAAKKQDDAADIELTKLTLKMEKIEAMQIDVDCMKYGYTRIIRGLYARP